MLNIIVIIISLVLGNRIVKFFTRNMIMSTYVYFVINLIAMAIVYTFIGGFVGLT